MAVKTLSSTDPEDRKKFAEETELMKIFSHRNIVSLLGEYQYNCAGMCGGIGVCTWVCGYRGVCVGVWVCESKGAGVDAYMCGLCMWV